MVDFCHSYKEKSSGKGSFYKVFLLKSGSLLLWGLLLLDGISLLKGALWTYRDNFLHSAGEKEKAREHLPRMMKALT